MASIIKVDTIQTAAGGTPTAADLGLNTSGTVLQVVQHTDDTEYSVNSSSYAQGPQTGNITLSSASNKVLVTIKCVMQASRGSTIVGGRATIYRGSVASGTRVHSGTEPQYYAQDAGTEVYHFVQLQYLDSPNSTSVSYSLGFNRHPSSGIARIKGNFHTTTIIVQEIAG